MDSQTITGYIGGSVQVGERVAELARRGIEVEVIRGDEHTLLLDLDTAEAEAKFEKNLPILQKWIAFAVCAEWLSKSGNTHVVLKCHENYPPLTVRERAALQAFLGSDQTRELASWFQANQYPEEDPHVLFRPKRTEGKSNV